MAIRGILKPMPDYQSHYCAGVEILKEGRAFTVDEEAIDEAWKRVRPRLPEDEISDPHGVKFAFKSGVDHLHESGVRVEGIKYRAGVTSTGKPVESFSYRIYDEPGKPLLLDRAAYEHLFKPGFGVRMICEPVDGAGVGAVSSKTMERMSTLEEELGAARRRIAELEAAGAVSSKTMERMSTLEEELGAARRRVAELEAAGAASTSATGVSVSAEGDGGRGRKR